MTTPPEKLSPDEWARRKGLPAWKLAVARAHHDGSDDHATRVPWLPNGQLDEATFDACVARACNATLR